MELHSGGELFDRIVGRPRFTEDEVGFGVWVKGGGRGGRGAGGWGRARVFVWGSRYGWGWKRG